MNQPTLTQNITLSYIFSLPSPLQRTHLFSLRTRDSKQDSLLLKEEWAMKIQSRVLKVPRYIHSWKTSRTYSLPRLLETSFKLICI